MKLLICDDDISTIDIIQSQLDCQELGIQSILRAYNGKVAMEIIEKEKPEIILCDIQMPLFSGIEVLKFVRARKIPAEFAFITNYESFEFAREAIRYGATNYITKPLDIDELRIALLEMINEAKKKKSVQGSQENGITPDLSLNEVFRRVRDGALRTDIEKIDALLRRSRAGFSADSMWRVIYIMGDVNEALCNGWTFEALTGSLEQTAEEALTGRAGDVRAIADSGDRYAFITCFIPADKFTDIELRQKCGQLFHLCGLQYSVKPVCIISDGFPFYKTAEVLPVIRAKLTKLRFQQGSIYFLNDRFEFRGDLPRINEERVIRMVRERRREEFIELVSAQVDRVVHTRIEDDRMVVQLHQDLIQAFYSCLKGEGLSVRVLFDDPQMLELDKNAELSVPDIMAFARGFYDKTVQIMQAQAEQGDTVAIAKAYIQKHFRENIDRDKIAAVVSITPNYLSKRFKTETGINIREYVNQLRAEEAKRLLLTTDMTISEIASTVGFDNISYFSTVFKKICGASPVEWRQGEGRRSS